MRGEHDNAPGSEVRKENDKAADQTAQQYQPTLEEDLYGGSDEEREIKR